jgi:hypothetical protein
MAADKEREEREEIVEMRALEALGKGFDLTSDFRLKFAKGSKRLVAVDEFNKRDIVIPGGPTICGVPQDIRCDKGDRLRFKSDVLEFNQVCLFFFFLMICLIKMDLIDLIYLT